MPTKSVYFDDPDDHVLEHSTLDAIISSPTGDRKDVMTTNQQAKIHYMDLLNEITSGERRAGVTFKAWADKCQDPSLKSCLEFVAKRETSHYEIFRRCQEELGGTWEDSDDPTFHEWLMVNMSDLPDIEKLRYSQTRQRRNREQQQGPTRGQKIDAAIADETVDQLTRDLLKWFAGVEADTGVSIGKEYARLEAINKE